MAVADTAVSDTLIGAGAGLVGALIGGFSTLLASRFQWRRESRKAVYAELLTASHEVRWTIISGEVASSTNKPDPLFRFLERLDAASLVASYGVQTLFDRWRPEAEELRAREELPSERSERNKVLETWNNYHHAFQDQAKEELRIRGRLGNRRLAYGVASALTVMAWFFSLYLEGFPDRAVFATLPILAILVYGVRIASRAETHVLLGAMVLAIAGILLAALFRVDPSLVYLSLLMLFLWAIGLQVAWPKIRPFVLPQLSPALLAFRRFIRRTLGLDRTAS